MHPITALSSFSPTSLAFMVFEIQAKILWQWKRKEGERARVKFREQFWWGTGIEPSGFRVSEAAPRWWTWAECRKSFRNATRTWMSPALTSSPKAIASPIWSELFPALWARPTKGESSKSTLSCLVAYDYDYSCSCFRWFVLSFEFFCSGLSLYHCIVIGVSFVYCNWGFFAWVLGFLWLMWTG